MCTTNQPTVIAKPKKEHLLNAQGFRTFMFEGRAQFTCKNIETGNYITFHVHRPKYLYSRANTYSRRYINFHKKRENPNIYQVYVKALGDEVYGKLHIGQIDRYTGEFTFFNSYWNYKQSRRLPLADHPGVKTIQYIIKYWKRLEEIIGTKMDVFHIEKCCKCGLPLSVEESVINGMGDKCLKNHLKGNDAIFLELGIYRKDRDPNQMLAEALKINPILIQKLFIPPTFPRNEFIETLELADDFGLF